MLAKDIKVGSVYVAKVSAKLTQVRVDKIDDHAFVGLKSDGFGRRVSKYGTRYHVTNLKTGRQTTFRSASKFREEVPQGQPQ